MYRIEFHEKVDQDLKEISDHIGVELCNPIAADRIGEMILKNICLLEDMPYIYPIADLQGDHKFEYRKMTVRKYIVFYHVAEESKTVYIDRVIHGSRDHSRLLR